MTLQIGSLILASLRPMPCVLAVRIRAVRSLSARPLATLGAGRWGQLDLAGDVSEWNLDYYSADGHYVDPCTDCSYLTAASARVLRGGDFADDSLRLFPANRGGDTPSDGYITRASGAPELHDAKREDLVNDRPWRQGLPSRRAARRPLEGRSSPPE
jgi:hypothetical protein